MVEGIFIYYKYIHIALADCPPETGGRGAKRRRGWIKPITTTYYLSTPSPLRGTHPCLRGRKWMLGYCRNTKSPISYCNFVRASLWELLPSHGHRNTLVFLHRPSSSLSCKGIGGGAVFRSLFYCMIFCITFGIYGNCITFA